MCVCVYTIADSCLALTYSELVELAADCRPFSPVIESDRFILTHDHDPDSQKCICNL